MRKKTLAFIAVLVLTVSLLTACGGKQDDPPPPPEDPAPVEDTAENNEPVTLPDAVPVPDETPEPAPEPAPEGEAEELREAPEEEAPAVPDSAPAEVQPEPEPAPAPAPEPEPEPDTGLADGTYTIAVTLAGGSGRASVESPCTLRVSGGEYWAAIVWSSPNYDYMKVNGQRYELISTEGNSAFEIPVSAFDQALPVVADTIAMSEPHEIEYTLTFDSASIQ